MLFDKFLLGVLMEEAGDAGGGVALADPSSDFSTDSGADTSTGTETEVHDAEFVEPAEGADRSQEPGTALVKAGERAVTNGKFTQSGRAAIEAVQALSPNLAKELKLSLLVTDWFRKEFPGGKPEVAKLRQLAQDHGGESGIAELQTTAQFFNELDELFSNSDPRFLEQITTTPEEQKAFAGLMGPAFDKFQKVDPQGFSHQVSKAFVHLMDQARVPVITARMVDLLNRAAKYGQNGQHEMAAGFIAEITQSYNELADVLGSVYNAASKTPERKASDPQLSDRERQLTEREKSLQQSEWNSQVSAERKRVFSKAFADMTKGRNITPDQDQTIKGFYELRMNAKVKQWQNNAARFQQNGDREGYLREQYAFFQKAIPEALRQAIQQAIPAKPGPKAQSGPVKPPVSRGTTTSVAKGAIRVAKMPPTSELDPVRTTGAMLSENKAIRKDGTLVQWS